MDIIWKSEERRLNDLIPADYNPRKISDEERNNIKQSIERFSLCDPIVINKNNKIIGGHQRFSILKEKGNITVDVRVPNILLDEKQEKELNLRLNKNLAQWDFQLLSNYDEDLLKDVGFFKEELDKIFNEGYNEKDDEVPENPPAIVQKGQIYKLGRHRLMCGDATLNNEVLLLMNGEKSKMIHTDPPYNVNYAANKKHPSHKIRKIENDNQSPEEWEDFCKDLFVNFKEFNDGDIYMWGASGPEGMRMRLWLVEFGCHWSATIIWKKQQLVLSPAKYQRMYEPCFYGWFNKSTFGADRKETEVWEIDRPHNSKLHPTMKPIEICEKAIKNSSQRNDIVLDLFLGSGSTLIACEKTNRICYGMEIEPHYCDVIIKRWEDYTDKKAVLIN